MSPTLRFVSKIETVDGCELQKSTEESDASKGMKSGSASNTYSHFRLHRPALLEESEGA